MESNHCDDGHVHAHQEADSAVDPVCGMTVDPAVTGHHAAHAGRTYHFCSAKCRERFVARPEIFLTGAPQSTSSPTNVIYTCPMHSQIEQIGAVSLMLTRLHCAHLSRGARGLSS